MLTTSCHKNFNPNDKTYLLKNTKQCTTEKLMFLFIHNKFLCYWMSSNSNSTWSCCVILLCYVCMMRVMEHQTCEQTNYRKSVDGDSKTNNGPSASCPHANSKFIFYAFTHSPKINFKVRTTIIFVAYQNIPSCVNHVTIPNYNLNYDKITPFCLTLFYCAPTKCGK